MAKPPLTLAPRYFSHSSEPSGKVLRKRKGYPEHLQKSHVMVTGGREGPLVSAKKVPREERPTLTGWKGAPSAGWTTELEKDGTPKDARTQSGYLRRVRPEQRAWARGVMRVPDIEYVLYGGLAPSDRIDLDVAGRPRVELTLWIADEALFASITGYVEAIRVVTVEDASVLGVEESKRTIRNANAVSNTALYAEMMGIIFVPDKEAVFFGDNTAVALPYYLVGRARRIHEAEGRPWRVSGRPTVAANKPVDASFEHRIAGLEKSRQDALVEAGVAEALSPKNRDGSPMTPYTRDLTLDVSLTPVGAEAGLRALRATSQDRNLATSGLADELALMNIFRTAGAEARLMRGKTASVLKKPHDPLDIKQKPRRRRKKTAPKDPLKMFSNPRIMGVSYTVVTQAELDRMARLTHTSVEQIRLQYPRFITPDESKVMQAREAAKKSSEVATWTGAGYSAPARRGQYRRLANPAAQPQTGDHLYVPAEDHHCVVRRVMNDGRVIVQGFEPAASGERVRKYYPFQSVEAGHLRNAEVVERGFADRMRALKAAGN